MIKNKEFLIKASQLELADILGYDEARAYYLLLTKKENELESEFSYSKRYRIMKSLFEAGAVAKFKQGDKDFFSYLLLPPSFLYFSEGEKVDKEIIELLESIYLENHSEMLEKELQQIILKDERPLLAFFLKYIMKEEAKLTSPDNLINLYMAKNSKKIEFKICKDGEKRVGLIDRTISFEFAQIPNPKAKEKEYMGYISRTPR